MRLDDSAFVTEFSRLAQPALRVQSGDTVTLRTRDCYMNNLRAPADPRGPADGPAIGCNPATGPIYVSGARPGDALMCEVLAIDVGGYATMRVGPGAGFMKHHLSETSVRAFDLRSGAAALCGAAVPLDPMIGVIGVAPAGFPVDTATPGSHGGNMDTRVIRAGSVVYLPVACDGALLALGDVHAQMGDGEVAICGLECPADVTVRLTGLPGRAEPWPVVISTEGVSCVCSAETLDQAARLAADAMFMFLLRRTEMGRNEIAMLMSLACDLAICQVVDPLLTVRMTLRQGVLPGLTY
ncbi:MAG: acetamidase [Clostridiales bacterium]|nr:acetamidase [Clostridiales bacterium]